MSYSYFNNVMPIAGKKMRSFTLQINDYGGCVMYELGDDGKPVNFVAHDSVLHMLADMSTKLAPLLIWHPAVVQDFGANNYWSEVAEILNFKKNPRVKIEALLLARHCIGFNKFLEWTRDGFVLTDAAKAEDQRRRDGS